ncbi:MAG: DinB family protein [Desulfobacteraceae bacterium]|nr:DinB family protein [Desulfobacteraceae bacterium]
MSEQSKDLANRLRAFNEEVISFVRNCTGEDWGRVCPWEEWPVGVVARHIGAGHYQAVALARAIVAGEKLPELGMDEVTRMANEHAREHAGCSREEVMDLLRETGREAADYVAGLSDEELDRTGTLALAGGEISVRRLLENVILLSGGRHFANMKEAVRR